MNEMYAHVSIRILEKEYQVACPANEKADLVASAELLNKKMREIRDSGKVVGLDRVAVMAALNMANELLRRTGEDQELKDIGSVNPLIVSFGGPASEIAQEHLSSKYKNIVKMPHYSAYITIEEQIEQMHKIIEDYDRN